MQNAVKPILVRPGQQWYTYIDEIWRNVWCATLK